MPTKLKKAEETRADDEIAREIRRKMKADFDIPAERVMVTVTGGLVTLEGLVMRYSQKEAAERCVREVKGVREVTNRLAIAANGS
jgi:osmotically-inducible protein OsmY